MKIAICGTSGTGKTTLATALSTRLGVPLIAEDFKAVAEAGFQVGRAIGREQRAEALAVYLAEIDAWLNRREERALSMDAGYVMDRFSFDVPRMIVASRLDIGSQRLQALINRCQRQAADLDLVVLLPLNAWMMETERNEDGLKRSRSLMNRLSSQSTLIGVLQQFCPVPRLDINQRLETTEQRVEAVLGALEKLRQRVTGGK